MTLWSIDDGDDSFTDVSRSRLLSLIPDMLPLLRKKEAKRWMVYCGLLAGISMEELLPSSLGCWPCRYESFLLIGNASLQNRLALQYTAKHIVNTTPPTIDNVTFITFIWS